MFEVADDIQLAQELLSVDLRRLAARCDIGVATLARWLKSPEAASQKSLERFYGAMYREGIRFNAIKSQLYREDAPEGTKVLFHGSKSGIDGPVTINRSREKNDFGQGFYCGETLEQSSMFVSNFPLSSVYVGALKVDGLKRLRYGVERNWMLSVALCRKRLEVYSGHPELSALKAEIEGADYVVAPIADNRMYEVINAFCEGEITDEQCLHSLSATDLGLQYVIKSQKALDHLDIFEQCYLCQDEKEACARRSVELAAVGLDKAKAARRKYRGQGSYVEELFS